MLDTTTHNVATGVSSDSAVMFMLYGTNDKKFGIMKVFNQVILCLSVSNVKVMLRFKI